MKHFFASVAFSVSILPTLNAAPSDGVFNSRDTDRNGSLDLGEFAWMMGEKGPNLAGFQMRTYREFFRSDLDQSGALSKSEFALWIRGKRPELVAEVYERFAVVDRNRDKLLDAAELAKLYRPALSKKAALTQVRQLDSNADAKLSRAECFRYLPMENRTFLGMKLSDAQELLAMVQVKSFVWRTDDIAYPYDPVIGETQPLFVFGTNGGIITDCRMRLNASDLVGESAETVIALAETFGLKVAAPSFPRWRDCLTTFPYPMTLPQIYCPPFDDLDYDFPLNEGKTLPNQLFLEIGAFEGEVEHVQLTRGGQQLVFIQ